LTSKIPEDVTIIPQLPIPNFSSSTTPLPTFTQQNQNNIIEIEIPPTLEIPSFFLTPTPTYPQALKPSSLDPRLLEDLTDEGVPTVHIVLYGCGGGFVALMAIGGTVYWVLLRRQRSGTVAIRRSRTVSDPQVYRILF
jgi:hypothetical protein